MKTLRSAAAIALIFSSTQAFAGEYDCTARMITDDGFSIEESFVVPSETGSHGGAEKNYAAGPYELNVSADGRWLQVEWKKDNTTLAATQFVIGGLATQARVIVVYNPTNLNEQVSLGCEPRE